MITPEEAASLKSFKNPCNCGGYAHSMNGRDKMQPHMHWCPQAAEFAEWRAAMDLYEATQAATQERQK